MAPRRMQGMMLRQESRAYQQDVSRLRYKTEQAAGGRGSSEVHSSTGHKHIPGCWAIARSGIPAHEPLFNGTICRHPGRWGQLAQSRGFTFGSDGGVEHLEVHPICPLLLTFVFAIYHCRLCARGL